MMFLPSSEDYELNEAEAFVKEARALRLFRTDSATTAGIVLAFMSRVISFHCLQWVFKSVFCLDEILFSVIQRPL